MNRYYSASEAAEILGITRQGVHYALERGDITPAAMIGERFGFTRDELDRFARRRALNATGASQEGTTEKEAGA